MTAGYSVFLEQDDADVRQQTEALGARDASEPVFPHAVQVAALLRVADGILQEGHVDLEVRVRHFYLVGDLLVGLCLHDEPLPHGQLELLVVGQLEHVVQIRHQLESPVGFDEQVCLGVEVEHRESVVAR